MPTSGVIRYTRLRRPASPSARFAADWAINPSFHLGGGAGAKSTPQTGLRHISNRSRVCRNGNWKMASGDWRRKATGFRAESPEFAGQRLGRASITRRNVGSTCTAGNRIGETALAGWLAGWGGRIRTHKCRFQNWPLKCGPNFPSFRNVWRSETFLG